MTDTASAAEYDRSSTGWDLEPGQQPSPRPEPARQRCGPYITPDARSEAWGDHRVTYPGTSCDATECHVAHHPTVMPGWAEPMEGFHERPGVQPIAAAFHGWDAAGILPRPLGDMTAWVAAHVALDALRDAGFTITPPSPAVSRG